MALGDWFDWGVKPHPGSTNPTGLTDAAHRLEIDAYKQQLAQLRREREAMMHAMHADALRGAQQSLILGPPIPPPKYYQFSVHVKECEGGYVVTMPDTLHVVTDLTTLGELAVRHMATRALEKE